MSRLRKILSSLINYVRFWKDKDVPGVADQIRKTQLKQDQKSRKSDMEELLKLVSEGRLHEADERQLESLKMVLELNSLLDSRESLQPTIAPEQLVEAVKQAISEGMSNVTINALGGGGHAADPARPQMKHTSLTDLAQSKETVNISHKGGVSKEIEGEESTDKLEKLRKIKGGK
jgi:hypothetical protein